jgi:hypothetical protein
MCTSSNPITEKLIGILQYTIIFRITLTQTYNDLEFECLCQNALDKMYEFVSYTKSITNDDPRQKNKLQFDLIVSPGKA